MPGLLRGVARTAVIAGTASAVNGRVQRRQAERFADRDAQIIANRVEASEGALPPPPATAPTGVDVVDQLERLGALRTQGLLTEDEFAEQKAKLLGT